jgi:hypothetical protein
MDVLPRPRVVNLLDHEPRLLAPQRANGASRERAAHALRARVIELDPGPAAHGAWQAELEPPALGLLLLAGCLMRESPAGGGAALELLCPGDLLRPWEEPALPSERPARWRALRPCTLAVLDGAFARRAAPWPELPALLLSRLVRRGRYASLMLAIRELPRVEDRVLAVLWVLADRLGAVTSHGVRVHLPLRQADLGALAGARRPTVNVTLRLLREQGLLRAWTTSGFVLALEAGDLVAARLASGEEFAR